MLRTHALTSLPVPTLQAAMFTFGSITVIRISFGYVSILAMDITASEISALVSILTNQAAVISPAMLYSTQRMVHMLRTGKLKITATAGTTSSIKPKDSTSM